MTLNRSATHGDSERGESLGTGFTTFAMLSKIVPRGGDARIMLAAGRSPTADASTTALIKALIRGYRWRQHILSGEVRSIAQIAKRSGVTVRYASRLTRLNFLAADIIEGVLDRRRRVASPSNRFCTLRPVTGTSSSVSCSDSRRPTTLSRKFPPT